MSHSVREEGRCMLNGENSLIMTEMIMKPDAIAAILLRLALTGKTSQEQLEALFEQY
jgi:hypothetical protein